jgi:hypothetical protein
MRRVVVIIAIAIALVVAIGIHSSRETLAVHGTDDVDEISTGVPPCGPP